jgi:hypothetical protein
LGFVDKKLILVGVGSSVCWRRRLFNLAEKIMPQFVQYRAKNVLRLKKLCSSGFFIQYRSELKSLTTQEYP